MAKKQPPRQVFAHHFEANTEGSPFKVNGADDVEVTVVGNPDKWKRVSTPCAPDEHDLVLDPTEKSIEGHVGYKCRKCKIGWIVKEEQVVNN